MLYIRENKSLKSPIKFGQLAVNKNLKLRNSPMGLVPDSYTNIELLETNLAKAKEMLKHSHI